ncbi:MAG: hypothetical protein RBR42_04900 [Desulfomicrobium sp.]|nr:hypothetical protein [Desulfomicrobium sp.]
MPNESMIVPVDPTTMAVDFFTGQTGPDALMGCQSGVEIKLYLNRWREILREAMVTVELEMLGASLKKKD